MRGFMHWKGRESVDLETFQLSSLLYLLALAGATVQTRTQ
jgi:hypothetical protein